MYVNGVICKDEINPNHVTVEFMVDELMINNTPYVNYWTFCIMNDLVVQNSKEKRFESKINSVKLVLSKNEFRNEAIRKVFESMNIPICS